MCKNMATMGVVVALMATPGVDAAAAWAAYFGGGTMAVYAYFGCQ
jgi:hypothetical protein